MFSFNAEHVSAHSEHTDVWRSGQNFSDKGAARLNYVLAVVQNQEHFLVLQERQDAVQRFLRGVSQAEFSRNRLGQQSRVLQQVQKNAANAISEQRSNAIGHPPSQTGLARASGACQGD
jgi:hypothetical protein